MTFLHFGNIILKMCLQFIHPKRLNLAGVVATGICRTVFGDHKRYEETYFKVYPGYYFTGDGCRRDEDGYYWITGRVDDVLNVRSADMPLPRQRCTHWVHSHTR